MWRCARLLGRDPVAAIVFVGLNPIVLVWGLGGDHNDFFMVFFIVLAFYLLLRARAPGISPELDVSAERAAAGVVPAADDPLAALAAEVDHAGGRHATADPPATAGAPGTVISGTADPSATATAPRVRATRLEQCAGGSGRWRRRKWRRGSRWRARSR